MSTVFFGGQWRCERCSQINAAAETICRDCGSAIHSLPVATRPSTNMNSLRVRPGDWLCRKCHNNNFAKRLECNMCHTPKLLAEIDPTVLTPTKTTQK